MYLSDLGAQEPCLFRAAVQEDGRWPPCHPRTVDECSADAHITQPVRGRREV